MLNSLGLWRGVTILGFFGLVLTFVIWNGWFDRYQKVPYTLEILILTGPLLFFSYGLLQGRHSTHVKITFVAIIYFIIGIWLALTPDQEAYGYLITVFSILLYLGGFMTAKTMMKAELSKSGQSENL
ncbi:MAG: DUF2069 domain-containing protein [Thiotrichaceae bacterium]|nr:DUF2069 domain-containing protein [Thiotrichaceae bacterium]